MFVNDVVCSSLRASGGRSWIKVHSGSALYILSVLFLGGLVFPLSLLLLIQQSDISCCCLTFTESCDLDTHTFKI